MDTTVPKHESAKLILQLYEQRREAKLREARDWFFRQKLDTAEQIIEIIKGPDSAKYRQLVSYWDMAAALVNHGAIDAQMYFDTNGEHLVVYAKLQPALEGLRKEFPHYSLMHTEKMVQQHAQAKQIVAMIQERMA